MADFHGPGSGLALVTHGLENDLANPGTTTPTLAVTDDGDGSVTPVVTNNAGQTSRLKYRYSDDTDWTVGNSLYGNGTITGPTGLNKGTGTGWYTFWAVVYDAGSVKPFTPEMLARTDVAMVSRVFAETMFAHRDWEQACRALSEMGPSYAGVTLGEEGAVGLDGEEFFQVPPFKVDVVDTTGAGDVFHGALDVAILQGWDFKRCVTFAAAVAAMKCRRLGGRAGIPSFAEAQAFLKERGHDFGQASPARA